MDKIVERYELMNQGVQCSLAVLDALHDMGCFDALPTDPGERREHEHGNWLLNMLRSHLLHLRDRAAALNTANGEQANG